MVSYYEKGKWVGLLLDLELRQATGGRRGLPDLFRRLWRDFGQRGRGLDADDVRAAAEAIAGRSLGAFFARYIDGTDELPVPAALRRAGVDARARPPWADEDDRVRARRLRGWVGLQLATDRPVVKNVVPDSPAWRAGMTYGDELVAVDGQRVTASSAGKRLADHAPGETARVTFFRQDGLRTADVIVAETPERAWEFALAAQPPARPRAVRRGWLGV
jgi:predicted metalloprotease with PDZ domain